MLEWNVSQVANLGSQQREATIAFLDRQPAANAYQYPYDDGSSDLLFQLTRDGELCFSGRGCLVPGATRYLPWLRLLVFNRGPVAATVDDFQQGLQRCCDWARARHLLGLHFNPDLHPGELPAHVGALSLQQPEVFRHTLRMPLEPAPEAILAALPAACRYKIRRAGREGIAIVAGEDEAALNGFIAAHEDFCRSKSLSAATPAFFQALWRLRAADNSRVGLMLAIREGQLLGANLFFRSGSRCEYLFGANYRGLPGMHGHVASGYVLQWAGLLWGRAQGCTEHDFGGWRPAAQGGPAQMKAAFFHQPSAVELVSGCDIDLAPIINVPLRGLKSLFSRSHGHA